MKIRYFILCLIVELICICGMICIIDRRVDINKGIEKKRIQEIIEDKEIGIDNNTTLNNQLKLFAKSACVYDVRSNRFLYKKEANIKLPMASTTKIMTCIVALESGMLEKKALTSRYAVAMPKVKLGVSIGEEFLIKDLLYSLMLESHNDVAVVIAENIAAYTYNMQVDVNNTNQSRKLVGLFAKLMNDKVKELGLKNTSFVTPNGLDDINHYTTAMELAKIGAYAVKNKEFVEITNTKSYSFKNFRGKVYTVNNKNSFLNMYKGAIGCKTGYTSKAGYCFVGAINRQDYNLISVVLASGWPPHKTYKWLDTTKLMDYVISNYKNKKINLNNKLLELKAIGIDYGSKFKKEKLEVYINDSKNILLDDYDKISYRVVITKKVTVPIDKGEIVGVCRLYVNDQFVCSSNIKATKKVEKIKYIDMLNCLIVKAFIII